MGNSAVNVERVLAAGKNLGDVIVDPTLWPAILQQISDAVGATAAALFRSDKRTPDIPRTASATECYDNYFATGWHTHDTLAERGLPLLMTGAKVISDRNVVTADEMQRLDFYNEVLVPFGFKWFAGIGFRAGSALWAMLTLRSQRQGLFEGPEKRVLAELSQRLRTCPRVIAPGRGLLD